MVELFDFSYDRLTPAQVKAGGRVGVIRYVASGRPAVSASRAEVDSFLKAGMVFAAVWQKGRDTPLRGRAGGIADAKDAKAYTAGLGRKVGDVVYFAVDFDPTPAQYPAILGYFQGVATILGWEDIGAYANAPMIEYLSRRCSMCLYWLHNWGSGGKVPPAANMHQYRIDQRYLGKAVDYNRTYNGFYGQWRLAPVAWRVGKSLLKLRDQLNDAYPNRSRASDGFIGDAAHASRASDHNPWYVKDGVGVVTAGDFTHDPGDGLDAGKMARALGATKDRRIKYLISNGQIMSGANGPSPWQWRAYTGPNRHDKHFHMSVESGLSDDATAWRLPGTAAPPKPVQEVDELSAAEVKAINEHSDYLFRLATRGVLDPVKGTVSQNHYVNSTAYVRAQNTQILAALAAGLKAATERGDKLREFLTTVTGVAAGDREKILAEVAAMSADLQKALDAVEEPPVPEQLDVDPLEPPAQPE